MSGGGVDRKTSNPHYIPLAKNKLNTSGQLSNQNNNQQNTDSELASQYNILGMRRRKSLYSNETNSLLG